MEKIAIDLRYAENINSGLTRFSKNIFLNLIKEKSLKNHRFLIILPPKKSAKHLTEFTNLKNNNLVFYNWATRRNWRWKLGLYYIDIPLYFLLMKQRVHVYITPFMDCPILPNIKIISTIHDLTFLKVKGFFKNFDFLKKIFGELRIISTILLSNYIITVSESTKEELKKRFKYFPNFQYKKILDILIVNNGITDFKIEKGDFDFLSKDLPNYFFLYVGDRRPHKNLEYLIDITKSLRNKLSKNINLIIAGSNSYKNESLQKIINANRDFIIEYINPRDKELYSLYKNCKCFFLLSKSEGFGIPVIEAGVEKCKIVINSIPALKEIAPKNSLIINCESIYEDSIKIIDYLGNANRPDPKTIINRFRWQKSAKILSEFLLKIC